MQKELLTDLGFEAAEIPVSAVVFDPGLRRYCTAALCGGYGKNYACPPFIGEPEALIARAKRFSRVLVFRKVYAVEDAFDVEGYAAAGRAFRALSREAGKRAKAAGEPFLLLSAGGCQNCSPCAAVSGGICRFPDEVYPSLESFCVQVTALAKAAGLPYYSGPAAVAYFGALFFGQTPETAPVSSPVFSDSN